MQATDVERIVRRVRAAVRMGSGGDAAVVRRPRPHADVSLATVGGIAALIDHTRLKPEATRWQIERLCAEALEAGFATVCVNPVWVPVCVERLRGSGVRVCTVVGFPLGAVTADTKAHEARRAIFDGAHEIDMVINVGALKSGMLREAAADIGAVAGVCRVLQALCKVIIETALLDDEEKVAACALADLKGADYVKTSTGFGPGGATVADVALMRQVVGSRLGVKASGGVRDLAGLRAMVAAGATRIGTSAGMRILQDARQSGGSGG